MRPIRSACLAILLLSASVACTSEPGAVGTTTKVTYLTSFSTFGRDAYAYVAQEKGFFTGAGLEVTINPGSGTVDVLKLVAGGRAHFGVADATGTMITLTKEKMPVIAVAAVLFGARRLPDAARSLGQSARILRSELRAARDEEEPS